MRSINLLKVSFLILLFVSNQLYSQGMNPLPVTPKASKEATALLDYFYSISGKYILTGQHNYPNIKGRNTEFAKKFIGKTPVVYSTDWGFEKDGNTDSYLARPDIVKEAIHQHQQGSIITICWHAVPPTANEPVTFRPLPGANPYSLASVQGQLTDQQFKDLLTPGTPLYKHWCSQVDSIAKYLKQLQDAHVPILWRPYHEMNGNWFWWGARQGKYSTVALYKQLFDRLVNFHKLNNLVWVWSVDRPNSEAMKFVNFYPGTKYLDVLALDVYGNDFKQEFYDNLLTLSEGKPIVLGEVGNPPSPEIMEKQPRWAYYVLWAGMVRNITKKQYYHLSEDGHYLYQEDEAYIQSVVPYRLACKLPALEPSPSTHPDFSGYWVFNEEKSSLGNSGASQLPYEIHVYQENNSIELLKTILLEYTDNRVDTLKLNLDGQELVTQFWNAPMKTTAQWIAGSDTLEIKSIAHVTWGDRSGDVINNEKWYVTDNGRTLNIEQYSNNFWGERTIIMVFDKIGI
jgi:mannan endo-1,4-beta-mannosidase